MNKKFDLNHEWEVPSFDCIEFKSKKSKYALTIPVINEGDRIRNQLLKIDSIFQGTLDIIIADGGSEDGSLDDFFLKKVGVRALLRTKVSQGLGFQLRMAYFWILNENYQGIITVDGNNKDGMSAISQFIEKLDKGYDYVQGSRYLTGGRSENTPIDRIIGNKFIHAPLLSFFAKYKFTDTTNGFRGYSKSFLEDNRLKIFRGIFKEYELLFYLTFMAAKLDKKICEIPVERIYPNKYSQNRVPTKINTYYKKGQIFVSLLKVLLGFYNPK